MTKAFIPILTAILFTVLSFSPLSAQVFFEEDFDGGIPATWTLEEQISSGGPFSTWLFTTEGPTGPFLVDPLASTTAANGWAMFDSDSDCNHPAGQDAWLISPVLDCSGKSTVFIQFETFFRSFNDQPFVMVGTDLGDLSSWTGFEVFPGVQANQYGDLTNNGATNPQVIALDLSSAAANQPAVYIAFRFLSTSETANGGNLTGCGYSWQIDDVVLTEENLIPAHDMQVNNNFFAVAPNLIWPLEMVEPFGFLADISNQGSEAQTGVSLNISVEGPDGSIVFTEDLAYGEIIPDSVAENVPFVGTFEPTEPGVYIGTYTVSADSTDLNPDNNSQTFQFLVSDTLFAKENGVETITGPAASNWDAGEAWSWAYGNYFYVPAAGNNIFKHVFFAIDTEASQQGETVTVNVYKWTDTNADEQADPAERTLVAQMLYPIEGDESGGDLIALPVTTLLGDPVALEDDTHYLVMVEYATDVEGTTIAMGVASSVDYGAMIFRSGLDGAPRYGSFLGINTPLEEEPYSSLGFGTDLVPAVSISFGEPNSVREEILLDADLAVFPNPANSQITLDMNFTETMKDVTIQLFDINGKLIESRRMNNIEKQQAEFNVQSLTPGAYLFKVTTGKGTRAVRFTVQH